MKKDIATRNDIEFMVNSFYEKVQKNNDLNNVFNNVAKINWEHHLPKMYAFWESVIFGEANYKGNPLAAHKNLHQKFPFTPQLFNDWLTIFIENVDANFEGDGALKAKNSARSIAIVLQTKTVYAK